MGLVPADVIAEATSAIRKTERIEDQQARRDAYEAAEEGASWTSNLAFHSASIYLGMTSLTRGPRGSLPGDYSVIEELQALFRTPYEEHSDALSRKYFRRTPALWVPNC